MSEEVFYPLFLVIILYAIVFAFATTLSGGLAFSLKANYDRWKELNWLGVWFFTILYWIAFLPFTIIAFIYWIFTTGRE